MGPVETIPSGVCAKSEVGIFYHFGAIGI